MKTVEKFVEWEIISGKDTLKQKTLKNIGTVGLMRIFIKILRTITLIILARLLLPSDFGIVAIAGIVIAIIEQVKDFGIFTAVIQRKGNFEESLQTGFMIRLGLGIFLYCAILIIAPFWAHFFNDQVITSVLRILAISILLENFRFVPYTKLSKELKFKTIVISDFLGNISYSGVAIILAYMDYSFWSIVYGKIVQILVSIIYLWIKCPWEFYIRFDKKIAKELVSYGKYVFATVFFLIVINNMNYVVLGKVLGPEVLGYYLIAYTWATFSSRELNTIVDQVLFPTFSKIQSDVSRVGNAYISTLKYTSIISIPISFGTFAIAPEFVNIVLGEKWAFSIIPLQILCIAGVLQSIYSSSGSLYFSIGKPQITTRLEGMRLLFMLLLIVPATIFFGIIGVASIVSFSNVIITPINFHYIGKILDMKKRRFVELLISPTLSAILMIIFIFGIKEYNKRLDFISEYSVVYLIFLVLSGIIVYLFSLFLLNKRKVKTHLSHI